VTERAHTFLKNDAEREEGGTPGIVESIRYARWALAGGCNQREPAEYVSTQRALGELATFSASIRMPRQPPGGGWATGQVRACISTERCDWRRRHRGDRGPVCPNARTHTHTHAHAHTHAHTRTHAHTHRHTHRRARAHTHASTRTHTHTRTDTRTHARTHTHTRTRTHTRTGMSSHALRPSMTGSRARGH
jgi:hypothetical protein